MANPSKTKKASTTSAKNWKKRSGTDLELPSGNVCKVKRPGMEKLLSAGVMPDSLTPMALEAIKKGESGPGSGPASEEAERKVLEEMMKDQNAISEIFLTFDKVTAMCVVEPKVRLHLYTNEDVDLLGVEQALVGKEIPEDERDDDLLYTDDVDSEDKQFIFNYVVGGTKDLESFREQSGATVADLQSR